MEMATAEGREALSCGSSFFTRSTTSMMLAPGWRWMFRITAGSRFFQAACRTSSTPSITVATSDSTTGELSLYLTTTFLYCSLVSS
jgi:hypothetical protein